MELSEIDATPPETASHQGELRDARAPEPPRWQSPPYPRETDEHDESHLVRGYD